MADGGNGMCLLGGPCTDESMEAGRGQEGPGGPRARARTTAQPSAPAARMYPMSVGLKGSNQEDVKKYSKT